MPAAQGLAFRQKLAWKAFQHCASYDSQVAEWLWGQVGGGAPAPALSVPMTLAQGLRYGENPHQAAAFYTDDSLAEAGRGGVATSVQHGGKEMSYNNYLDADAAYGAACDFTARLPPLAHAALRTPRLRHFRRLPPSFLDRLPPPIARPPTPHVRRSPRA